VVAALAFLATAVATRFWQTMLVRWTSRRRPHEAAWTVSLALFALACAALATGASTGWDIGTFRAFYLFGTVNVVWLALGTIWLLAPARVARACRDVVLAYTALTAGVVLAAPTRAPVTGNDIPAGRELFGPLPRVLVVVGNSLGATVLLVGAVWSAWRYWRGTAGAQRDGRMALSNALIAVGTVLLASSGVFTGFLSHDEAFVVCLLAGLVVIYAGFLVSVGWSPATSRSRSSRPVGVRGSSSVHEADPGHL
jgi:hypothetical protein